MAPPNSIFPADLFVKRLSMGLSRTVKILELFSGTHSVGNVARELGWDVTSLDLSDADICGDILKWPYWLKDPGLYDVIWASPPCESFSTMQGLVKK